MALTVPVLVVISPVFVSRNVGTLIADIHVSSPLPKCEMRRHLLPSALSPPNRHSSSHPPMSSTSWTYTAPAVNVPDFSVGFTQHPGVKLQTFGPRIIWENKLVAVRGHSMGEPWRTCAPGVSGISFYLKMSLAHENSWQCTRVLSNSSPALPFQRHGPTDF